MRLPLSEQTLLLDTTGRVFCAFRRKHIATHHMLASVLRANFRVREVNRHNPARNQRGLHQLRLVEVFCSFHLSISATNRCSMDWFSAR